MAQKHIVKRAGHSEEFDQRKLYASVFSTLRVVGVSDQEAELVSEKVVQYVEQSLASKHEVTSKDILHRATKHLRQFNEDAAYLYEHHRSVS